MPSEDSNSFLTPVEQTSRNFPAEPPVVGGNGPIPITERPSPIEREANRLKAKQDRTCWDYREMDLLDNKKANHFAKAIASLEEMLRDSESMSYCDDQDRLIYYYLCCCLDVPADAVKDVVKYLFENKNIVYRTGFDRHEILRLDKEEHSECRQRINNGPLSQLPGAGEQVIAAIEKDSRQDKARQKQYGIPALKIKNSLEALIQKNLVVAYLKMYNVHHFLNIQENEHMQHYIQAKTKLLMRNILRNFLDTNEAFTLCGMKDAIDRVYAEIHQRKLPLDEKSNLFAKFFTISCFPETTVPTRVAIFEQSHPLAAEEALAKRKSSAIPFGLSFC